jgi:3-hydroxyacyl-[acyl-carrier-protein] dehydratase
MPQNLLELARIDFTKVVADQETIRRFNPQRYEMEMLTRVCHLDLDVGEAAGVLEVPEDPWWARGHVPGRPIMPGVLMLEAAAQLCSFCAWQVYDPVTYAGRFFGFGGLEDVKFRWVVVPGQTMFVLGKKVEVRPRRAVFDTQGIVEGRVCFEARIIGMWI